MDYSKNIERGNRKSADQSASEELLIEDFVSGNNTAVN